MTFLFVLFRYLFFVSSFYQFSKQDKWIVFPFVSSASMLTITPWLQFYCFSRVRIMVFNATSNNISVIPWQSILLLEETGISRENHWPVASHWQNFYHIMLYRVHIAWAGFKLTTSVVIGTDCKGSYKYNYHTIMAMIIKDTQLMFEILVNILRKKLGLSISSSSHVSCFCHDIDDKVYTCR